MRQVLIVSDLHFDNKPNNEYRFGLFEQVLDVAKSHKVKTLYILGDVLQNKDQHPGKLINRVLDGLVLWANAVEEVVILHGNHDSLEADNPYLYFVRHIPKLRYINKITKGGGIIWLPHTRNPNHHWGGLDFSNQIVYAHMTVVGSVYESGVHAEGSDLVDPSMFKRAKFVLSGDIHSPQTVSMIHYIGCPYQVRFGDKFQGNCVVFNEETLELTRVPLDFPRLVTIDTVSEEDSKLQLFANTKPGDKVKIRLRINQENMHEWQEIKGKLVDLADRYSVELYSLEIIKDLYTEPKSNSEPVSKTIDYFSEYCSEQKLDKELVSVGRSLLSN